MTKIRCDGPHVDDHLSTCPDRAACDIGAPCAEVRLLAAPHEARPLTPVHWFGLGWFAAMLTCAFIVQVVIWTTS